MQPRRQQGRETHLEDGAGQRWPFCAGVMAGAIRDRDWSASPLGPVAGWAPALRFALAGILETRFPSLIAWGPDRTGLYNDACIPLFGTRPAPLGRPFHETWSDIWGALEPIYARALAGAPSFFEDLPLLVPRPGEPDLSWWTFSCAPVRDEAGRIGGVQATILETSARVRLERRQALLLAIGDAQRGLGEAVEIAATACALLGRHLGADRVAFAEIDAAAGLARVGRGWTSDERPDRPGSYPLPGFGERLIAQLHAGQTAVVDDVAGDPRTAGGAIYPAYGIGAFLAVPLIREGRWVNALSVAMARPHAWTREEAGLVAAVAERTWEAVERARAETGLRRSRDRLDAALDAARMVAWDWDPATDHAVLSGSVEAVFGLRPGEAIRSSRDGLACLHPDDLERHRAVLVEAGARREAYESEFRVVRRVDDTVGWLEERARPQVDPVTGEISLTGLVWDVTRRKQAEVAREAAQAEVADELATMRRLHDWAVRVAQPSQWQALLDEMLAATIAVLRADFGTIRLYEPDADTLGVIAQLGCDPAYLERFGTVPLSEDSIWSRALGRRERIVISDLEAECAQPLLRSLSGFRFHAVQVTPLFDRTGAPVGALTTAFRQPHRLTLREWRLVDLYGAQISDVIGARQAREAIAASEERQRSLIEGMPQLVWRSRPNGRGTWFSPQWFAYTGMSREQSLDLGWLGAIHPDDHRRIFDAWAEAGMVGAYEAECRIWSARERRYRWFQERAVAKPVGGDGAVEWIGTSTDVDALRTLQEHQRTLLAELQHRVRNTLLRLRTIVRRSAASAGGGEGAARYVMRLESRLDALVRAQGPVMRDPHAGVDLYELVANELTAQQAHDGERARIAGPPVRLRPGAADLLALALHELAINAIEHGALARLRGRVRVSWRVEEDAGAALHFRWEETGRAGPPAAAEANPPHEGFGFALLRRTLAEVLDARTEIAFGPGGLTCTIVLPLTPHIALP